MYCTSMNNKEKEETFLKYSFRIDLLAHGSYASYLAKDFSVG